MKLLLLSVAVLGCALAEGPYPPSGYRPQGALLVLPTEARQYQTDESQNLQEVSENVRERLGQEQGAGAGVYYVYLPDGRLQRADYRSAPLRARPSSSSGNSNPQVNLQNSQTFQHANTLQFNQQNRQATGRLQYPGQPQFGESRQSYSQLRLPGSSGEYDRQLSAVNGIAPAASHLQAVQSRGQVSGRLENFGQGPNSYSRVGVQGPGAAGIEGAGSDEVRQQQRPAPAPAQYQYEALQLQQLQAQQLGGWLATIQYTDLQPIPAPIYSYSPTPLVRILRYAPQYQ